MYEKDPTAEFAAFGFQPEDLGDAGVDILPDNVMAVNAFIAMTTQWRVGANGATGFDYTALPVVFRLQQIPRKDHSDTFEAVRVMEAEALAYFGEQRD